MNAAEQQLLRDLSEVLQKHNVIWQDALPLIAEHAEEQCIEEPSPRMVIAFTTAAALLRAAALALRGR